MGQTDEVYVVDTWNLDDMRFNVIDANQVRSGILMLLWLARTSYCMSTSYTLNIGIKAEGRSPKDECQY